MAKKPAAIIELDCDLSSVGEKEWTALLAMAVGLFGNKGGSATLLRHQLNRRGRQKRKMVVMQRVVSKPHADT